jgi:hypothetical protein
MNQYRNMNKSPPKRNMRNPGTERRIFPVSWITFLARIVRAWSVDRLKHKIVSVGPEEYGVSVLGEKSKL